MTLPEFQLQFPRRLEEASRVLRDEGTRAVAMAGGTDVMVLMKQGTLSPRVLVLLAGLEELQGIRRENGAVSIGGGTTIAAAGSNDLIARHAPALVDAARRMGTTQVRNLATVAGNLASAAACGDLAPVLVALDARLRLRDATGGRDLFVADLFTGVRATVLVPGELITEIRVPAGEPGSGSAYVKFGYRRGAQVAVVSAAAHVAQERGRVRSVRLAMGAVAPTPLLVRGASALVGHRVEGDALEAACSSAASECSPISDLRGSESYRRAMASVIARRALELAWRRSLDREP